MKLSALPYKKARYTEEVSFLSWFNIAKKIGLDGVELFYPWPMEWHIVDLTKKTLDDLGLAVSAITTDGPDLFQANDNVRKQTIEVFKGYCHLTQFFNSKLLNVYASWWNPSLREFTQSRAVDVVANAVRPILKIAEEFDVTLVLENHPGMVLEKEILLEILERVNSPRFLWNFDSENAYRVDGQDAYTFLKEPRILKHMAYSHIKNFKTTAEGWQPCSLEKGDLDIKSILKVIKDSGYDGWFSIESGAWDFEQVEASAKFMRRVWADI